MKFWSTEPIVVELKEKIKDLERELRYQEKDHALAVERAILKEKRDGLFLEQKLTERQAQIEEMEKRWDESIQKQQSDLIKALAVKLPTLNISDLHAHKECK